jgi:hypothetical protein
MGKTRVALAATLMLAGCQSSPEGDLKKLGRAVKQGDSAEAVRYLDVDRTTTSLINEFVSLALRDTGKGERSGGASELGSEMGEELIRMMQPAIEGMVQQGVYDVISGRPVRVPAALAKRQADTVSRDSILQLEPRILRTRSFSDSAFVTVEIHPRARTETLVVKMEHPDKVWRVVRLDGLESLLDSTPK